ncbi:hypothetical protein NDU88_001015 [Pleurodeles waltl]|uniref:Uncharacterized protein n=1 Tax=Pleurodeles waltl TaxID=8319 RepID=A0AAV7WH45_PLEWA|nr:hypothetical protein NDU88_001015 [Pleurodeles waltl]
MFSLGGHGRVTKQDGSLERELRAAAILGGATGAQRQPENPLHPALLIPTTVVPLICALGLGRCEPEGQKLLAR